MPTSSALALHFFLLLLLLTCAFRPISCASTVTSRRSLHQPYYLQDSLPPSQQPSHPPPPPPSPTFPFSSSSDSTPTNSPVFFPTYPSPPPPPSPPSYTTFPANISSILLPKSPSSTSSRKKFFPFAVAAIVASVLISALALILFVRRRRRSRGVSEEAETKTFSSANNGGPPTSEANTVSVKQRAAASSTSSELLYREGSGEGIDTRKLDSPDLQPLPPLARQSHRQNHDRTPSAAEETEEEFYSPRAESGSRRAFACFGANLEDSGRRRSHSSSTGTGSSSSSSDSPSRSRSQSISLSPAVSLSPRRSHSKSPGRLSDTAESEPHYTVTVDESKTPLLSSQLTSPDRDSDMNLPRSFSAVYGRNPQSPSLSPLSWSPGRALERNPEISLRLWNIPDSNRQSLSSSLISSPSPGRRSNSSNRIKDSILLSALGRSLERAVEVESTAPPPQPPPPPPPPMLSRQLQQNPTNLAPISKPPSLIPPSRPFMLQNPQNIPPVESELPPTSYESIEKLEDSMAKPKLKPLHWDKVRATSDREMVWDQLGSSSFKLNEEMIETLFVAPSSRTKDTTPRSVLSYQNHENRVLDPKKSQNIAILLRALNVSIEEVCEALLEGNADTLGTELLEGLLKMAPTKEEERKFKDYIDDSPSKLGPAEKFLKAMLDVPYAFKRIEAMLYIANFDSEVDYLKKSFETLEAACEELRNSRMFMKLLEAVLKTGNRMNVGTNRGDALAFKLETLHKLVDVKGADGRTTLLHFVVQEMIKSEGARLSGTNPDPSEDAKCRKLGLQVVSGITSDLTNVKKAAAMDSEVLSNDVSKLSRGIKTIEETVRLIESSGCDDFSSKFSESMNGFIKMAEDEIIRIQGQEKVAMFLVKEITEYFHGDSAKEEAHPFRMFLIVRDFLTVLDRVCKEVGSVSERTVIGSAHRFPVQANPLLPIPVNPMLPQVLPSFSATERFSSSDDESLSP